MGLVHTEVDGVPTVWLHRDRPERAGGVLRAGLVFRVGRADETLTTGGVTHLVEHLALHRVGIEGRQHNGTTAGIVTEFSFRGDADGLCRYLATVCAGLRDLPAERVVAEKSILRTEAAGNGGSITGELRRRRYGPVAFGLPSYPEFGLEGLTIDDLRRWSARWFTRGNAALWLVGGRPPSGLRLDLPDGPRMPVPAAPSALPRTPAFYTADVNGVGFEAVLSRSAAAVVYAEVLSQRLTAVLRRELGLSYLTTAVYDPRDAGHASVIAVADALPEIRDQLTGPFVDVLTDLVRDGVTEDELAAARAARRGAEAEPDAPLAWARAAVAGLLTGAPTPSLECARAELDRLTADQVTRAAGEALDTGLLMVPVGQAVGRAGFTPVPAGSARPVTGQRYAPAGGDGDRRGLVIGEDGVSLTDGPKTVTVQYATCVGLLAYPDGAQLLFGPDGQTIVIEPTLWDDPWEVMYAVRRRVPAERVAAMPERAPEEIPQPEPVEAAQAGPWRGRRLLARTAFAGLVLTPVAAAGLVLLANSDQPMLAVFTGALAVAAVKGVAARLPLLREED